MVSSLNTHANLETSFASTLNRKVFSPEWQIQCTVKGRNRKNYSLRPKLAPGRNWEEQQRATRGELCRLGHSPGIKKGGGLSGLESSTSQKEAPNATAVTPHNALSNQGGRWGDKGPSFLSPGSEGWEQGEARMLKCKSHPLCTTHRAEKVPSSTGTPVNSGYYTDSKYMRNFYNFNEKLLLKVWINTL